MMLGMTSMLLRVLFSRRPTVFRNICVEKKKKEKTVFDSRCRCDKCVQKRKLEQKTEPELDSLAVPERKNKPLAPTANNIHLETLQRRKTISEGQGEELILKVPHQVTSSRNK